MKVCAYMEFSIKGQKKYCVICSIVNRKRKKKNGKENNKISLFRAFNHQLLVNL